MTKWILAAGAAALAITSPALADRGGQGGGKGSGKGGEHAAKAQKGGGGKAHVAKADRGGGDKKQSQAVRLSGSDNKGKNRGQGAVKVRDENRVVLKSRDWDDRRVGTVRIDDDDRFGRRFAGRGLIDGCPPGLAKKLNGCLPPGQAKKLVGTRWGDPLGRALLPGMFRTWYPDNDDYVYRMRDGYVYRIDRDRGLINGLFPMFDNDGDYFTVGQRYPLDYGFYNVPLQYQPYYVDSGDYFYRYGDGGIYQVNRSNGLIEGIAALLAGDLAVGQRLPMGYDAYNVPYGYRTTYYDTPNSWYRYNDGYIYRVDPATQLITAVISALV